MNYLIYYQDKAALIAELITARPELVESVEGEAIPVFLLNSAESICPGPESITLVRSAVVSPDRLEGLATVEVWGTYEQVFADPAKKAIYERLDPREPIVWKDEQEVEHTRQPPERFIDFPAARITKKDATTKVLEFAEEARQAITAGAGLLKVSGWTDKALIAQRQINGVATPEEVASLEQEAADRGRGETVDQLAARILVKAAAYRNARSAVDGLEDAALGAVNAAADDEVGRVLAQAKASAEERLKTILANLAAV